MTQAAQLAAYGSQGVSLGFKNRIINGDMRIDQRNGGLSASASDQVYSVDRWKFYSSQSAKFTVQQNAGGVTPPAGFRNYLGYTSTSALSTVSGDYFAPVQIIEGYNIADFGWGTADAQTVTLSFWVRSSLTGTFSGGITNNGNSRGYVFTYTVNAANTWEYKTITIPGDTSGNWLYNNNGGLELRFRIGGGTAYTSTTVGSWTGSNVLGTPTGVNVVATNGATWYITGVQLEKGSTATPFEYRDYTRELQMCQRYCFVIRGTGSVNGEAAGMVGVVSNATTIHRAQTSFPVTMRSAPSLVTNPVGTLRIYDGAAVAQVTSVTGNFSSANFMQLDFGLTSGTFTAGKAAIVLLADSQPSTSCYIFNAEL